MFRFQYNKFYKKYIDNIDNEDFFKPMTDMDILIYDELEKYDPKKDVYSKFLVTDIKNIKLFKHLSDKYESIYPYGLYILPDYQNSKGENWLLFVFPIDYDDKYIANHFTFVKNKHICNFHLTEYTRDDDEDIHKFDDFKDNFHMPIEGYENLPIMKTFLKRRVLKYHQSIIDIIRFPWIHNLKGGGTKRTRETSTRHQPTSKSSILDDDSKLAEIFDKLSIETMLIFTFRKNRLYHTSVHVYDQHHREDRDKTQIRMMVHFIHKQRYGEKQMRKVIKSELRTLGIVQ